MKHFRLEWTDFALSDLKDHHSFLEKTVSLEYADKVVLSIISRAEQLEKFPLSGKREFLLEDLRQEHRYLVETHWKIIYRLIGNVVYITDVFDTRQAPSKLTVKQNKK